MQWRWWDVDAFKEKSNSQETENETHKWKNETHKKLTNETHKKMKLTRNWKKWEKKWDAQETKKWDSQETDKWNWKMYLTRKWKMKKKNETYKKLDQKLVETCLVAHPSFQREKPVSPDFKFHLFTGFHFDQIHSCHICP